MRPDFDTYMMRIAYLTSMRATCPRKHVGAVIATPDHRILSAGYNGAPRGIPSCDDVGCLIDNGHCTRSLHAESNCLDFAGRAAKGCTVYVTVTPCWDCAKRIAQASLCRVVFDEFYASRYERSTYVVDYLHEAGIEVVQFEEGRMSSFRQLLTQL